LTCVIFSIKRLCFYAVQ